MSTFGFLLHPLSARDVGRKYAITRRFPDSWVEAILHLMSPQYISHITGIRSATGQEIDGHFGGVPLTSRQLSAYPPEKCYPKIIETGKLVAEHGAKIIGLGAHTAVVGDAGHTVAEGLDVPVTTGNTYTVATAVEGAVKAAGVMGTDIASAEAAVLGAGGSIGRVCSLLLAPQVSVLRLGDRDEARLEALAPEVKAEGCPEVTVHTDIPSAVRGADVVIAVTSAVHAVVEADMLKPGAVVCDVARPRDVSRQVAQERPDVLVIEGGAVAVPGDVEFGFDFGFPPKTAYACMAETMILTLEGRLESYSLGRGIEVEKTREIAALAARQGFALAGFRSFERQLSDEDIARTREAAKMATRGARVAR
ncbi:MAG: shikimate dehydrogenase [Armatimonadota bacterium]